jgi:hypothetical protein
MSRDIDAALTGKVKGPFNKALVFLVPAILIQRYRFIFFQITEILS